MTNILLHLLAVNPYDYDGDLSSCNNCGLSHGAGILVLVLSLFVLAVTYAVDRFRKKP